MMMDGHTLYLIVILALVSALVVSSIRPAGLFACALLLCWGLGFIDTNTLTHNVANQGLLSLLLLMSVSLALEKTALLRSFSSRFISKNYLFTLIRLTMISAASSAFLSNTAVVSTLTGVIKKSQLHAPSRLLLPLSYAAILGGTITLIGTSTNLIINSFLEEQTGHSLSMFSFAAVGLAATGIGILVIVVVSHFLPVISTEQASPHSYLTEATVAKDSPMIGKTVQENGLRDLDGLFLVEIVRADALVAPVGPHHRLAENDRLIFTGDMSKVMQLNEFPGLVLFAHSNGLLRSNLREVIITHTSDLVGKTLKSNGFRARFDAAVVAIHRNGSQLSGKLGMIELQIGDRLVLATGSDFDSRNNLDKNFYFVTEHAVQRPFKRWQEVSIITGFTCVVVLAATNMVPLVVGLLLLLAVFMMTGVLTPAEVKRRFPFDLLVIIVSALGLANAFEGAGLTVALSEWMLQYQQISPYAALITLYFLTLITTEAITNNAAAALMFPLGYGVAMGLGVDPMSFVMAVAFGASASFISPYSYQTNLIVFNAGQYQFRDFVKAGLPLSLAYSAVVLYTLPIFFPFS